MTNCPTCGRSDARPEEAIREAVTAEKIEDGMPATTAGSDKHMIAKTKGTRAEKFAVIKKPLDEPRETRRTAFGGRRT